MASFSLPLPTPARASAPSSILGRIVEAARATPAATGADLFFDHKLTLVDAERKMTGQAKSRLWI